MRVKAIERAFRYFVESDKRVSHVRQRNSLIEVVNLLSLVAFFFPPGLIPILMEILYQSHQLQETHKIGL